jgi:integrase
MKQNLTKRLLESLKPNSEKRIVVKDTEVPGLEVRVSQRGERVFFLYYRNQNGEQRRPKIGAYPKIDVDGARKKARAWLTEVDHGGDPSHEKKQARQGVTLGEFYDDHFLPAIRARVKESTVGWYDDVFRAHLRPALGAKKITAISRTDIVRLHASLRETPYAANRTLAALRSILNYAVELGLIQSNPALRIKKNKEHSRERVLRPEEISRLMTALDDAEKSGTSPHVTNAIRFIFWSGARKTEATKLEWAWIDGERKTIRYPDIASKGGAKTVPISPPAWQIIEKQRAFQETGPYVFCGQNGPAYIDHPWREIRKAAGLPDLRLHDLRHSALTYGALLGLSGPMLKGLAGHKDLATTQKYLHVAGDSGPLHTAADLLGVALQKALEVGNGKTLDLAVAAQAEEEAQQGAAGGA